MTGEAPGSHPSGRNSIRILFKNLDAPGLSWTSTEPSALNTSSRNASGKVAVGSGPREAIPVRRPPDPRRLVRHVRLVGIGGLLLRARAVARRQLGDRIDHVPVFGPPADHEDHARPLACAHEDVLRPSRAVEAVPC